MSNYNTFLFAVLIIGSIYYMGHLTKYHLNEIKKLWRK